MSSSILLLLLLTCAGTRFKWLTFVVMHAPVQWPAVRQRGKRCNSTTNQGRTVVSWINLPCVSCIRARSCSNSKHMEIVVILCLYASNGVKSSLTCPVVVRESLYIKWRAPIHAHHRAVLLVRRLPVKLGKEAEIMM